MTPELENRIKLAIRNAYSRGVTRPSDIAKNLTPRVTSSEVSFVMNKNGILKHVVATKRPTTKAGKTFDSFKAENDLHQKIRNGIREHLPKDGDIYYSDEEFRELCAVPIQRWRRYADSEEFREWQIKLQGRIHWAPKPMIEKMKLLLS